MSMTDRIVKAIASLNVAESGKDTAVCELFTQQAIAHALIDIAQSLESIRRFGVDQAELE